MASCSMPEVTVGAEHIPFGGFGMVAGSRPWRGVGYSLLIHAVAIQAFWIILQQFPLEARVRRIEYRVIPASSLLLHLRQDPQEAPPEERPKPVEQAKVEPPKIAAPEPQATAGSRAAVLRRFELPHLENRSDSPQTLLQPDSAPDLAPPANTKLPELILWSANLPKPRAKQFVVPGRTAAPAAAPSMTEAPRLDVPIAGGTYEGVAAITGAGQNAKLQLPPRSSAPLRDFKAPPAKQSGPFSAGGSAAGESAAVIALNPMPAPARTIVEVPPGNQIGSLEVTVPAYVAPKEVAVNGTGSGRGTASAGTGTGNGGGTASAGAGTGTGGGTASAGAGTGTAMHGGAPSGPLPPIRKTYPKDGVFDVVITTSNPNELPEISRVLTGNPIHTVYLDVGHGDEWILRYCVPEAPKNAQANSYVITLDNPAPVKAPFPRATIAPQLKTVAGKTSLLHGFITAKGDFRNLEAVRPEDEGTMKVLGPFLGDWEFRPATRDGVAVEIEVVLVVPRHAL